MARSPAAVSRRPSPAAGAHVRRRRGGRRRGHAGWLVVLGVAGGLLAGAAWAGAGTSAGTALGGAPGERDRDVAYRTGAAEESVSAAGNAAAARRADRAFRTSATARTGAGGAAALTQQAVRVLRGWDRARAAAYAAGSVRSLRALYDDGAGEADVRLLRSYLRRGYRVEHLSMQLLAVRVVRHRPGLWSLRVTDRVAGAVAVGYGERVALPRDRASTRTVVLRRADTGEWRVAGVRD